MPCPSLSPNRPTHETATRDRREGFSPQFNFPFLPPSLPLCPRLFRFPFCPRYFMGPITLSLNLHNALWNERRGERVREIERVWKRSLDVVLLWYVQLPILLLCAFSSMYLSSCKRRRLVTDSAICSSLHFCMWWHIVWHAFFIRELLIVQDWLDTIESRNDQSHSSSLWNICVRFSPQ